MTSNVIERATGSGTLAASGGVVERTFLMVRASRYARDLQRRAQEDAAIDAEDILTQAEEANGLDPVG
jgi:hypothetical protein